MVSSRDKLKMCIAVILLMNLFPINGAGVLSNNENDFVYRERLRTRKSRYRNDWLNLLRNSESKDRCKGITLSLSFELRRMLVYLQKPF